ncbi:hypothetical protein EAF04_008496 [Stromatinia cepivora]|nr:hypothetical protein EAF04_008496 [Stromatinia cepivora]
MEEKDTSLTQVKLELYEDVLHRIKSISSKSPRHQIRVHDEIRSSYKLFYTNSRYKNFPESRRIWEILRKVYTSLLDNDHAAFTAAFPEFNNAKPGDNLDRTLIAPSAIPRYGFGTLYLGYFDRDCAGMRKTLRAATIHVLKRDLAFQQQPMEGKDTSLSSADLALYGLMLQEIESLALLKNDKAWIDKRLHSAYTWADEDSKESKNVEAYIIWRVLGTVYESLSPTHNGLAHIERSKGYGRILELKYARPIVRSMIASDVVPGDGFGKSPAIMTHLTKGYAYIKATLDAAKKYADMRDEHNRPQTEAEAEAEAEFPGPTYDLAYSIDVTGKRSVPGALIGERGKSVVESSKILGVHIRFVRNLCRRGKDYILVEPELADLSKPKDTAKLQNAVNVIQRWMNRRPNKSLLEYLIKQKYPGSTNIMAAG